MKWGSHDGTRTLRLGDGVARRRNSGDERDPGSAPRAPGGVRLDVGPAVVSVEHGRSVRVGAPAHQHRAGDGRPVALVQTDGGQPLF